MHELVVSSVYNSNNCVFLILEFNVAFKNRKDFGPLNIIYICIIYIRCRCVAELCLYNIRRRYGLLLPQLTSRV